MSIGKISSREAINVDEHWKDILQRAKKNLWRLCIGSFKMSFL
jgi:hypothetical protein